MRDVVCAMLAETTFHDAIAAISLVMDVLMTVGLFYVTAKAKKIDELEDRVHTVTTKLIDERFRAMTHEVMSHVQGFVTTLDEMKSRLEDGDGQLRQLASVDQKIEIQVIERMSALKDWLRDNLASKTDLKEHEKNVAGKFEKVEARVASMAQSVAVLSDRVGGRERA